MWSSYLYGSFLVAALDCSSSVPVGDIPPEKHVMPPKGSDPNQVDKRAVVLPEGAVGRERDQARPGDTLRGLMANHL